MTHHIALLIRLFKVLSPFHKAIYINTVAIITSQGIRTFSIAQSAFAINSLIAGEIHSAYIHLAIALGLGFTDMIITYFNDHYQVYAYDFSLYNHLQEYSLRNIFKLNISQFYEDHSALKLTVVQRGEMSIQYFTESIFNTLLPTVSMMVFALGAIFWYSPTAAAITLGVFAVTFIMVWKFTEYMRPLQKQNMDAWDEQQKVRAESFQHLPLIKTLGSTDRFIRAYIDNRESLTTLSKRIQVTRIRFGTARWSVLRTSQSGIVALLFWQAHSGALMIGTIFALTRWVDQTFDQLGSLQKLMRDFPVQFLYLEKYLAVIEKKAQFSEDGYRSIQSGDITIRNLTFLYGEAQAPALEDVSFTIPSLKKTALVGASGSGKSTIVKLLLRMYDAPSDTIFFGGAEIHTLDGDTLRKSIGYVEQHVDLFDDTIRKNINLAVHDRPELSDDELEELAHKARIDQFYHRLGTEKFNTRIGERGVKLSGGERQRIGIARALAKDPDLLIFDEATSALDSENEVYIKDAIDEAAKDRTTLLIAHRLSTIKDADHIVVMQLGKVVGSGTHDELMRTCEHYQTLVHHQTFE